MGWIGCVRCKKSRRHFVARTLALIAPIHPILHRVSCSYGMIPNAPKHYETRQNMSLGSNGVDHVRLLGKITTWLHGTNYCINCTSSVCFATSFMQLRNDPKCYETHRNIGIRSNEVDWLFSLCKIPMWLHGTNFCINCTYTVCFATSFMQLRNDPKCTKYYKTHRKNSIGSNGVDWLCLLRKIPTWLRGMNFWINWSSSPRFASSFMQLRNEPKCTQTLWNTPKHEFRVQWGGSGASVA